MPLSGVFATTIIIDNIAYKSIANIGVKPSINSENKQSLEVHIFDFDANIYAKNVCVIFTQKIRDEQKFSNIDELKKTNYKKIVVR